MDLSFNILDWFDDNIDNLDLTRNYIYVLKLVEDRYYVGRTSNFLKRMEEHFTNQGAIYTKKYKPLKIIEVVEELTKEDERLKTLDVMDKYGWEKVRGACWCSLKIKKPNIEKNKKPKRKKQNREIIYANDNNIKELYCEKNKNIIEISDILDLSPGLIAFRLEKMNVVTRRQLSKGYFEYINSDLYNLYIEKRRRKREQKIDDIKTDNINDEKIIVDLKNIKQIIRDKIIYANRV
jgi:predicted GIY-YIG superfamily endonuclease